MSEATPPRPSPPSTAGNNMRAYHFLRKVHLYLGLFCIPWMLVYATSGLFINHRPFFQEKLAEAQAFKTVSRQDFEAPEGLPADSRERARVLLEALGLEGPFNVAAGSNNARMTINRPSAGGAYRIIWDQAHGKVEVQRQSFHIFSWLARMHYQAGYGHEFLPATLWAVLVDVVCLSMWLWILTGIYLWLKKTRGWRRGVFGAACAAAGVALFCVLAAIFFG